MVLRPPQYSKPMHGTLARILVPTDFSLCAEAAFCHALYLAEWYKAEVHLLHVAEAGREAVVRWPRVDAWQGLPVRRQVIHAPEPAAAIVAYVRRHAVDFVIMGAHGDRATGRFLNQGVGSLMLGQVADQVVRHAPCPVLRVVMRNGRSPERVRRLLAPVDGSALSMLALAYARALAARYDARLDLVHVLDRRMPAADAEARARRDLVEAFDQTRGPAVSAAFHVVRGRPGRQIKALAQEQATDLVVLGAHSDRGRDGLGSIAERIVRGVPSPVLVVRSRQPEVAMPGRVQWGLPLQPPLS